MRAARGRPVGHVGRGEPASFQYDNSSQSVPVLVLVWNPRLASAKSARLPILLGTSPQRPPNVRPPALVQKLSQSLFSPWGVVLAAAPRQSPTRAQGVPGSPLPSLRPTPNFQPPAQPAQRSVLRQEPPSLPGQLPAPLHPQSRSPRNMCTIPAWWPPMLCGPCPFLTPPGAHTRLCARKPRDGPPPCGFKSVRGGGHTQPTLPNGRPKVSMFSETTKRNL